MDVAGEAGFGAEAVGDAVEGLLEDEWGLDTYGEGDGFVA